MQLVNRIEEYMLSRGNKKNQHYVDFDGIKMYYEQIGNVKGNQ